MSFAEPFRPHLKSVDALRLLWHISDVRVQVLEGDPAILPHHGLEGPPFDLRGQELWNVVIDPELPARRSIERRLTRLGVEPGSWLVGGVPVVALLPPEQDVRKTPLGPARVSGQEGGGIVRVFAPCTPVSFVRVS